MGIAFEVLGGCLRVAGLKEEGEGCLVGKRRAVVVFYLFPG